MSYVEVRLDSIKENPLNNRLMDPEQIAILADSIRMIGMMQPPVVYQDGAEYILLSGHKRIKALQYLKKPGSFIVVCNLVSKPKSKLDEMEKLSYNNIYRKSPEEVKQEISNMNDLWRTMESDVRKDMTEKLKMLFCQRFANHKSYIENPEKFLSDNFRPCPEYIRLTTGLSYSNKTIKNYIKESVGEDEMPFEAKDKTVTVKVPTVGGVVSKLKSICGIIDMLENEGTMSEKEEMCLCSIRESIRECLEDMKNE